MLPNKALQLTSHSAFQSVRDTVGIERRRFERATEALWLAAERQVRYTAAPLKASRLVVTWIVTGVGFTSVLAFLIGVVSALFDPDGGLRQLAASGTYFVLVFLAWFACVAPGVVGLCVLWPRIARSFPDVEGPVFILATAMASFASSLAVYLVVLGPGTDRWVAALPFLASWLPLVLPRVVFSRARAARTV